MSESGDETSAESSARPRVLTARNVTRMLALGANLGALLGVIVLIFELQQNRELMRAQVRHDLSAGIVEIAEGAAQSPQLAEALRLARTDEPLTDTQAYQVRLYFNGLYRYWEDVHYQYRADLYDDDEFLSQREAWRSSVSGSRHSRDYWCEARLQYSPEFREEIDALLPPSACTDR